MKERRKVSEAEKEDKVFVKQTVKQNREKA